MALRSHPGQLANQLQTIVHDPDGLRILFKILGDNGIVVTRQPSPNSAETGLIDKISGSQSVDGLVTQLQLFEMVDTDIIKVYHKHPDILNAVGDAYKHELAMSESIIALANRIGFANKTVIYRSLERLGIDFREARKQDPSQFPIYHAKQGILSSIDVLRIYHRRESAMPFVRQAYIDELAARNGNVKQFAADYGLSIKHAYREMLNLGLTRKEIVRL